MADCWVLGKASQLLPCFFLWTVLHGPSFEAIPALALWIKPFWILYFLWFSYLFTLICLSHKVLWSSQLCPLSSGMDLSSHLTHCLVSPFPVSTSRIASLCSHSGRSSPCLFGSHRLSFCPLRSNLIVNDWIFPKGAFSHGCKLAIYLSSYDFITAGLTPFSTSHTCLKHFIQHDSV